MPPPRPPLPPSSPASPFPLRLSGPIIKGFGRGSKELGIPTANIPLSGSSIDGHSNLSSGVYFGWAGVSVDADGNHLVPPAPAETLDPARPPESTSSSSSSPVPPPPPAPTFTPPPPGTPLTPFPTALSIGHNPFYANATRSCEIHLLHTFPRDFYGAWVKLVICGFIREERGDYGSVEELVEDIWKDVEVAREMLVGGGEGERGYRGCREEVERV